ncbi:hypothetical protein FBZ82_12330 [Azospirillum brasilense]|uniref:Uncharacterized protein n=2 Tax=Azospirillum brasilense TaxID=192 RepID=A0A560AH98_AZOBR|nr:hypothetical protein FBZ82_12330 [Azospirillum brasilense]
MTASEKTLSSQKNLTTLEKGSIDDKAKSIRDSAILLLDKVFKPDGSIYGIVILMILLGSTVWSFTFSMTIDVPNFFWQIDQNSIAKGVESLINPLIYTTLFFSFWLWASGSKRLFIKLFSIKVFLVWEISIVLIPIITLSIDGFNIVFLYFSPFIAIFIITFYLYAKYFLLSIKRKKPLKATLRFAIYKSFLSSQNNLKKQVKSRLASQMLAAAPIHILMVVVILNSFSSATTHLQSEKFLTIFPNAPGKVAVYRNGEYWIVKDVRKIPRILPSIEKNSLIMLPETNIAKIDDPKYSSIKTTKNRYKLIKLANIEDALDGISKKLIPEIILKLPEEAIE